MSTRAADEQWLRGYAAGAREVSIVRRLGYARGKGAMKRMLSAEARASWLDPWMETSGGWDAGFVDALLDSVGC